jgi:hypothetical protein
MSMAVLEAPQPRAQVRLEATERLGTITLDTGGRSGRPLTDIYNREEVMALWRHCCNGNGDGRFVTACNFTKGGQQVNFYRDQKVPLYQRLNSAYRTAIGRASKPSQQNAVCAYTHNENEETVIGACDFDAHPKGNAAAAEDWARAETYAWSSLRQSMSVESEFMLPQGFVFRVLEHTGGGFRLTLITKDYVSRDRMAEMLRFIANGMEAELAGSDHPLTIQSGMAEFAPDWATPAEGYGKATKLPGSYNPKRNAPSLTLFDDVEALVSELVAKERKSKEERIHSPEIKEQYVLLPSDISLQGGTTEEHQRRYAEASLEKVKAQLLAKHPATQGSRYNEGVKKLVGAAYEQMNERHIMDLVRRQYAATPGLEDNAQRHEKDGAAMIKVCERGWKRRLSQEEEAQYDRLTTDNERNAFRILRGWAKYAERQGKVMARLSSSQLAARIDADRSTIDAIRDRFHERRIIAAARIGGRNHFRWMPAPDTASNAADNGDPF